jgi:hypothetical protein
VAETGGATKAIAAPAEPKTVEAKAISAAPAGNPFGDEEGEEEAPVKRAAPKRNVVDTATAKPELKQAMASWLDDGEDEGE